MNENQVIEELAIELDEDGMVVVNDPELLKLVAGAGAGNGGGVIGYNGTCLWKPQ